ncbi:MAG: hypothetical protein ACI9MR_004002 [Myxococcota bacterium]|jgi:uncharacterized protein (DUF2132 family)
MSDEQTETPPQTPPKAPGAAAEGVLEQPRNPLHGITLKALLEILVEKHGWEALAAEVRIRSFKEAPSVKSSLTFLRKTPWARNKVEAIYLRDLRKVERNKKRKARRIAKAAEAEAIEAEAAEGQATEADAAEPAIEASVALPAPTE